MAERFELGLTFEDVRKVEALERETGLTPAALLDAGRNGRLTRYGIPGVEHEDGAVSSFVPGITIDTQKDKIIIRGDQ